MQKSDEIKNLAASLAKFQSKVANPKNTADNPFFKSKYAPLNEILSDVRPLLSQEGLSIMQYPSGDGEHIIIHTVLMHESGEWIEMDPLTLKAVKVDPQGAGSAITYGRRYSLSAVLGISSEDDDDGNGASPAGNNTKGDNRPPNNQQAPKQQNTGSGSNSSTPGNVTGPVISEPQAKRLFAIAKGNEDIVRSVLADYHYTSSKDVKKSDYEKICKVIQERA